MTRLLAMWALFALAAAVIWIGVPTVLARRLERCNPCEPPPLEPPVRRTASWGRSFLYVFSWQLLLNFTGWGISTPLWWVGSLSAMAVPALLEHFAIWLVNRHRLSLLPKGWSWVNENSLRGAVRGVPVVVYRRKGLPPEEPWTYARDGKPARESYEAAGYALAASWSC